MNQNSSSKMVPLKSTLTFIILFLLLLASPVRSQDLLTLEDVIRITIENNFDIEVAKNNIQVAKNNNNIGLVGGGQSTGGTVVGGTTGMLPQISIGAGSPQSPLGFGRTTSTLKYSNPAANITDQTLNSKSYAPSIVVTWYFFDGLKMFATKSKLNRAEELSNLQYRLTVENTLLASLTAYYQMISIKQFIKSLQTSLMLGEDQKKLAQEKLKAGIGSAVDVLQTQIDYNNILVQISQQQNLLNEQRINLNLSLKRLPDVDFSVPDTIVIQTKPEYTSALDNTYKNNNSILIGRKNLEIDRLAMKEFRANAWPKIGITGNYNYFYSSNDIGFMRLNQNYGYNGGFIFSWTILNNLTTRTAIKNSTLQIASDNTRLEASELQEKSNLYKAYLSFQNNLKIIDLGKQSVQLSNQNLYIAAQRFKQGLSTYIEYRTVQQSYETAQYQLSQAAYSTKLSELNFLKAQGLLVH
ncbi:MAG: TolC family protein [Bacteroidetes bacterium]|nr:TolC family protein [Bacteroidota bacterium]